MKLRLEIQNPKLRTRAESNSEDNVHVKRRRAKGQKELLRGELLLWRRLAVLPPAHVNFRRFSAGTMDDDNLPSSMKYLRDELAAFLAHGGKPGWWEHQAGKGDSPKDLVTWSYDQEVCKKGYHAVEIDVVRAVDLLPLTYDGRYGR